MWRRGLLHAAGCLSAGVGSNVEVPPEQEIELACTRNPTSGAISKGIEIRISKRFPQPKFNAVIFPSAGTETTEG